MDDQDYEALEAAEMAEMAFEDENRDLLMEIDRLREENSELKATVQNLLDEGDQ